ncbi:aldo/keto reductase [Rhodothermus marinus]|uniref:aldo/keto reductase n=1 Tax=Rhodothermus marinus TaxID=29549 RepID=UPI0037C6ED38
MTKEIQGTPVPALGLGTWGLWGVVCERAVAQALALGYRHIDTARAYDNEAEIGRALRRSGVDRASVFLTTKVWWDQLAPEALRRSVETSLRLLQTDYVDLLLIHWPNPHVPLPRTLEAMLRLQAEGKVRHLGVSNFSPALLCEALRHAPIFCNQVEYHPYLRQEALLELARRHDLLLTAYCPLARGLVRRDPVLQEIGRRYGKTAAQVALRWLVQQDHVAAVPKAARLEHLRENLAIFDFSLTPDEMARIDRLARGLRLIDPPWAPDWNAPGDC